jgi:hypothetical protein
MPKSDNSDNRNLGAPEHPVTGANSLEIFLKRKHMQKFVRSAVVFGAFALASGFAFAQTSSGAITVPIAKKNASPEQLARLTEKAELIRQIFKAAQPDMRGRHVSPESQRWLLESLYQMPLQQIRSMGMPGTFSGAANAMIQTKSMMTTKALGDTTQDLVYKAFVPCRYIDTRNVDGKINGVRGYDLSLGASSYGGAAGCDPLTLAGVDENSFGGLAMNVTIFDTSSVAPPGFLAMRPAGSTNVTSLLNWYVQGAFVQDANYAIVTMDQTPLTNEFEVVTSAPVHVIVDLMGVFIAPNATALDCVTLYNPSATSVPAGTEACANPPACPATYEVTASLFDKSFAANDGLVVSQMNLNVPGLQVCGRATLGAASFKAGAQCCRVPGR